MENFDQEPQVGETMNSNIGRDRQVGNSELVPPSSAEQFEVGTEHEDRHAELANRYNVEPRFDYDSPDGRWRLFRARHIQMMSLGKCDLEAVI
jgi:amino acid permease